MEKTDYELCEEICQEVGCYYPDKEWKFKREVANIPAWIRYYFHYKGYKKHIAQFK